MKSGNFFAELKRRKVYKVAAAYLIVAWSLVQAASIGFPAFDAPPWVLRLIVGSESSLDFQSRLSCSPGPSSSPRKESGARKMSILPPGAFRKIAPGFMSR